MLTKLTIDCKSGVARNTKIAFGGVVLNSLSEISVKVSSNNLTEASMSCDLKTICPEGDIQCVYQGRPLLVHFEADPGHCRIIDIETDLTLAGVVGFEVQLDMDGPQLVIHWGKGPLRAVAGTVVPEDIGLERTRPEDEEFAILEKVWLGFNDKLIKCTVISRTTTYSSGKPVVNYKLESENGVIYSEIKPSRIIKEKDYAGD